MSDVVYGCLGVAVGLFLFHGGFRAIRERRKVGGLATSRARSAAMGVVELSGRAREGTRFVDPVFARPCALFRLEVFERRGSGKRRRWVRIHAASSGEESFFLEDRTGLAEIRPNGAELHFSNHISVTSGMFKRLFGARHPVYQFLDGFGGWSQKKLEADIVRQGDPIYVLGYAMPGSGGVTLEARDVARELKRYPRAMKELDRNQDGVVDSQEWDQGLARKREEREAAQTSAEPPIVVGRCPDGLFFLADSEKHLVGRLMWSAWAQIAMGSLLATGCAAATLIKLRIL